MNGRDIELLAELERRQIEADMHAIHRAEAAEAAQHRWNWFERRMFDLGGWMIHRGERIRDRHSQSPTSSARAHRLARSSGT